MVAKIADCEDIKGVVGRQRLATAYDLLAVEVHASMAFFLFCYSNNSDKLSFRLVKIINQP